VSGFRLGLPGDLAYRLNDQRGRPADGPADQMSSAVAVVDLGQPPVDVHLLAVGTGGHVAEGQGVCQRRRRGGELAAQDAG
jgi:hypothetical protein